jgi:Tfp pilus assembly protein PilN
MVACGSIGLSNMYLATQKDAGNKTFFLANAGKSELELFALRNGQLIYSREVQKNDDQSWDELLRGEINEAAARLRFGPDTILEKIVLTGESSRAVYEEIKDYIPDIDLLERAFPLAASEINRQSIQEATAVCGLAFTAIEASPAVRLNLLPPALRRRQGRWGIAVAAALGAVILLLLAGLGLIEPVQNGRRLAALEAETEKLEGQVRLVRGLETRSGSLEAQRKQMSGLLNDSDRNLDILKYLTEIFPNDTYLTSYTNSEGAIILNGQSGSYSDLDARLQKSPLLNAKPRGTVSRNSQTGRDVFQYYATLKQRKEE